MSLRPDFRFSQSSLQDYVDCPRRFAYRYVQHIRWPALQSEPVVEREQHAILGQRFHRLVHQQQVGMDENLLVSQTSAPELSVWWNSYVDASPLAALPASRYVEHTLSIPFMGYRLLAKYDILAVEPGQRAVIMDWKTSLHRPPSHHLRRRIQSRLYPFLVAAGSASLNGGHPLQPHQIEMCYWFPECPQDPECFRYSLESYEADRAYLAHLITEIEQTNPDAFPSCPDERICLYCVYRSLCGSGRQAGDWESEDELFGVDGHSQPTVDFNGLSEIGF